MAPRRTAPTIRLRRLAAELRRLRAASGLSREDVAARTNIDPATIYRIETARARRPQKRTLLAILALYGVDEQTQSELIALSREADRPGLLQPYTDELPGEYATYIGFEAEARAIVNYESLFIPGLLQTEDYARAVVVGTLPTATSEEVEHRVRARMERQALLDQPDPPRFWAIVDEAALHRRVGGSDVMQAQLARLAEAAVRPNITLQVIGFGAGAHPGMPGSYILLDFPDPADPAIVYIDSMAGDLFLEAEADIRRYRAITDSLRAVALGPTATLRLINELAASL
ncbi:helix-turn-helix transcriptional regulator [Pseudofrankia sp. BMG5.37]|uniref:helix-turn-helix domain-containing protein n=1 Tax=Pseudofrankia sp. BMG5.37 TaxID=3050035 RepID=UPI0028944C96|nr:helix-turn-helix transcriptional regulator [Pseudofrankia sp. BMG5.37]MDT3444473.1 helix-turn-helix transcriptional regulator [Pseudofrankia sp. BMG5.37]